MRVAIIGGYGHMGRWFSEFFVARGHKVVISGRDMKKAMKLRKEIGVETAKNNTDAIRNSDLIVVAVMISRFEDVIKQIAPYIEKDQKLIDITSVKEEPVRIMHKYIKEATILGTHPMFGPNASPEGQNFILTPTNAKEARFAGELGEFLESNGFVVSLSTPKKHDKMIGIVLALTHFVGFVTADSWRALGVDRSTYLSSTSFRFLKDFVNSIVDSSPELYSYLQMNLPNVPYAESVFVKKSKIWADMAKNKKRKEFVNRMAILKKYLDKID